jgi:hypothetical protein
VFRAIDQFQQGPIVAIDPQWAEPAAIQALRQWCREDRIRCPWCSAPVLIKAGQILSRHFAHKAVADCPYANEDPEKLQGRQVLYEWLLTKLGKEAVELEPNVKALDLPLPLDVLATHAGRRFGYSFLHRSIRECQKREAILDAIAHARVPGLTLHLVFSARMLQPLENHPDLFRLSSTQRDFAVKSTYDQPYWGIGSLHFLDTADRAVNTLRGLSSFDGSSSFRVGKRWANPISEVCITPGGGEIVHPGEHDALKAWSRAAADRKAAAAIPRHPAVWLEGRPCFGSEVGQGLRRTRAHPEMQRPERVACCSICGSETPEKDQIIYDGQTKMCKCRVCMGALETSRSRGEEEGG